MLVSGQHQAVLLCDAVAQLQLRRRFAPGRLTRSAQLDLLRDGALEALGEAPVPGCGWRLIHCFHKHIQQRVPCKKGGLEN